MQNSQQVTYGRNKKLQLEGSDYSHDDGNNDFGFYNPRDLDIITMCALMLRTYHIPPSVTLAQDKQVLEDVLTLLRVWDEEQPETKGDNSIW